MGVAASLNRSSSNTDVKQSQKSSSGPTPQSDAKQTTPSIADVKDSKSFKDPAPPANTPPPPRRMSLQDMMTPASAILSPRQASVINIWNTEQLTVGDIVRVTREGLKDAEGIVVEKVSNTKLRVDFGERIADCLIEDCVLIVHNYEFEVGDKVEARPPGMSLFFVGKVIAIHPDKSMDILMDGDDLSDIERNITAENCRKLMSRRSVVINRWKRAFMMVVAANFFKRISFAKASGDMQAPGKSLGSLLYTHEEDEKHYI